MFYGTVLFNNSWSSTFLYCTTKNRGDYTKYKCLTSQKWYSTSFSKGVWEPKRPITVIQQKGKIDFPTHFNSAPPNL
ncbi:Putative protein [Zobellia galactanivorans]|uniref:Uncharacterized protein n=1 Tax=Zobellia galactanivorans (strain DSM 12802 / CCUG 47099 / CIP 106680 / NCIMB 13871 / Dsij) TaxID=63186 RepID=G0LBR2_ZOBGA|nr:Putative protein [Zobellia galactanivorans]